MNIEKRYPRVVNVLLSVMGIGAAFLALRYFSNGNLGNALIFAGGALALLMLPFGNMPRAFYKLPLGKLADEMAHRPEPLWLRIAFLMSGLLVGRTCCSYFLQLILPGPSIQIRAAWFV